MENNEKETKEDLNNEINSKDKQTEQVEAEEKNTITKPANITSNELKPRKWLLWVLIVITIAIVGVLVYRTVYGLKTAYDKGTAGIFSIFKGRSGLEGGVSDIFNQAQNQINEAKTEAEKEEFNHQFDIYAGTGWGDETGRLLDRIIKNNKTNESGRLITLVYGNESTTDPVRIKDIKRTFEDFHDYEVSIDYGEDGYVNKVTVEY